MTSPYALPPTPEDVASFEGPFGFAVVRKPTSATAPKSIGNPEGKQFGFFRVVWVLKGKGTDVYQVKDEDEGKAVAQQLVSAGNLGSLKPNAGGRYKV